MNKKYEKPEIAVIEFNTGDIIAESTGNVLKSASFTPTGETSEVMFNNLWIDSYFAQ